MRYGWILAAGLVPMAAGCGGPKLAAVAGRITCDGKPVACAAVTFSPLPAGAADVESPRAASGAVNDGRLEYVTTFKKGDGAFVGRHRVMITLEHPESCPCLPVGEIVLDVKPGTNEFAIELRDYAVKKKK